MHQEETLEIQNCTEVDAKNPKTPKAYQTVPLGNKDKSTVIFIKLTLPFRNWFKKTTESGAPG